MQIGVTYPQTELPTDAVTVRNYVTAVEALGYQHVLIYDHVLGADPAVHGETSRPYTIDTTTGAGPLPLPVQRPIPIWMGGSSAAAYGRIGRLADGWFPQVVPGPS